MTCPEQCTEHATSNARTYVRTYKTGWGPCPILVTTHQIGRTLGNTREEEAR